MGTDDGLRRVVGHVKSCEAFQLRSMIWGAMASGSPVHGLWAGKKVLASDIIAPRGGWSLAPRQNGVGGVGALGARHFAAESPVLTLSVCICRFNCVLLLTVSSTQAYLIRCDARCFCHRSAYRLASNLSPRALMLVSNSVIFLAFQVAPLFPGTA